MKRVSPADIRNVLGEILDAELPSFAAETVAGDVEGWDSLNNVRLLLALESAYGIDFPVSDVEKLANVGELAALVNRLLAAT